MYNYRKNITVTKQYTIACRNTQSDQTARPTVVDLAHLVRLTVRHTVVDKALLIRLPNTWVSTKPNKSDCQTHVCRRSPPSQTARHTSVDTRVSMKPNESDCQTHGCRRSTTSQTARHTSVAEDQRVRLPDTRVDEAQQVRLPETHVSTKPNK